MPRNEQILRQWELLRRLEASSRGLCVREECGGDSNAERRMYHDLQALRDAGFPIYDERDDDGRKRHRLTDEFRRGYNTPIKPSEIFALRWLRRASDAFEISAVGGPIDDLIQRLDACLTEELRDYANRLDDVFVGDRFGPALSDAQQPLFMALSDACANRRSVDIVYENAKGGRSERRVDPYNLCRRGTGRYLIAWCHRREAVITFAIWRVRDVTTTDAAFEVLSGYSFETFTAEQFRTMDDGTTENVRIWFAPDAALYVMERRWHPSAEVRRADDGAVILVMTVSGMVEVASWVLSFGPRARVLEPPRLVELVCEELNGALEHYGAGKKAEEKAGAGKKTRAS